MVLKQAENLKGFAYQRPPLIIFLVCLLLFAIALISLGVYIQNHNVRNYEDKDWNDFFNDFSQQQFCIPLNDTITQATEQAVLNTQIVPTTQETDTYNLFNINDYVGVKNVSFSVILKFPAVNSPKWQYLVGLSNLGSTVGAQQIQLDEGYGDIEMAFQMTHPIEDANCDTDSCPATKLSACLTIAVAQGALPLISRSQHPAACNRSITHSLSAASVMFPRQVTQTSDFCSDGIIVNTDYLYDPHLTFYLSEEEKSIINLHLMYTSYFLFIMLITCVFYALVKGPPLKSRPLIDNGNHKKMLPL